MNTFDLLMTVACGCLAGTGAGLLAGAVLLRHGSASHEVTRTLVLAAVWSAIATASLFLLSPSPLA